jgi:hypothetical protein
MSTIIATMGYSSVAAAAAVTASTTTASSHDSAYTEWDFNELVFEHQGFFVSRLPQATTNSRPSLLLAAVWAPIRMRKHQHKRRHSIW